MKEIKRPYVILSAAMTIDGKIATKSGDPELSDENDWREVHKLRTQVDAIMVGKGTILKDNPKLHIKFFKHKGYYRIIVDSNLSIPLDSNVIIYQPEIYPTIICTTENVSMEKIKEFESRNVKIIKSGSGKQVDLTKLLLILSNMGIDSLLLEGGGNLNWSFIEYDLIDEMRLTIAPWIVGGKDAITLVEGAGFEKMKQGRKFKLLKVYKRDNFVVMKYRRKERL
ncbi:MAG: 2,5-diamino-6-(ribosylamino)-4(3H)-pyrimidinone 5'-phosphate reductase [Promethearchaeota archaeon]